MSVANHKMIILPVYTRLELDLDMLGLDRHRNHWQDKIADLFDK